MNTHTYDGKSHNKHVNSHGHMIKEYKTKLIVSTILTIPVLLISPGIQGFIGYGIDFPGRLVILWLLSTIIYLYGGKPFILGLYKEFKNRLPGMMTLIGTAITVAYIYSSLVVFLIPGKTFFWELATLIDVMLLGHWIEMKSVLGASRAVEELVKALPSRAHLVKPDGSIVDVYVSSIKKGDRVLVKPGEKIPVDGVVVEGSSTIDESLVTGESRPVYKDSGTRVIAGTINLDGSIIVEAEKIGGETYLAQVVELIKKIQASRSRVQDLVNRVAKYLTLIALTVGAVTFVAWYTLIGDPVFALERMVTVMVITCPHALGLAIPLVIARSTAITARRGILIRNRMVFENTHRVDTIMMDKTGTLTRGAPIVVEAIPLRKGVSKELLVSIAAGIEKHSSHPLAKAIMEYAGKKGIVPLDATEFQNIPGVGVRGIINGEEVLVVSPRYLSENGINVPVEADKYIREGYTVVYVVDRDDVIGFIVLDDEIRPESRDAVARLRETGLRVVMLTGDAIEVARRVASELGIEEYYAGVLPHEKAGVVEKLRGEGRIVMMVGDGVNDAPALVAADVGVAIGAGTDIAIESADIILVRNDPRSIVELIDISRRTYGKVKQNLGWAIGYNVFAIPAAAGILYGLGFLLPPALGALLMSMSTVIVAANSMTLR